MKTSENLRFSDVFKGYRNVTLGEYGLNTKSTSHYLLHCPFFADERKTLLSNIKSINFKFLEQRDSGTGSSL